MVDLIDGKPVKIRAPGHIAGAHQNAGFGVCKAVKLRPHIVHQLAGDQLVHPVPQLGRVLHFFGQPVAKVVGDAAHHALHIDQRRDMHRGGCLLHRGGGGVFGTPDMDKVGLGGCQKCR